MRIQIGAMVISEVTADDLPMLCELARAAGGGDAAVAALASVGGSGNGSPQTNPTDLAILRALVGGGKKGVASKWMSDSLGKIGRAMRPAAKDWAVRIGLCQPGAEPFEELTVNNTRSIKFNDALLDAAKIRLAQLEGKST